jgi:hypothetical protein
MFKGFKILCSKLAKGYKSVVASDFVQNIKAEQDTAKSDQYMPVIDESNKDVAKQKEEVKKQEPKKNPYAIDFEDPLRFDF